MIGSAVLGLSACEPKPVDFTVEATRYRNNKECAISFTYDDGMLCHYTDIAPELEKRGFKGTFWIIGANMGRDDKGYPWMTWEQVADLAKRGHELSNHTWNHPDLTKLTLDEVRRELVECDSMLEAVTGQRPITMAYPYNAMSNEVVALCSEGRVGTRTFQDGHGQIASNSTAESLTQWLNEQLAEKKWGVTMTHGTTYGWDMWNNPEVLYQFFDEVKAVEDRVWIGTFAEVAAYLAEQKAVQLVAEGTTAHCTISCTNPLDTNLYHEPLTLSLKGYDWQGKQVTAKQGTTQMDVVNADSVLYLQFLPSDTPLEVSWK